jgi:hypothetical protein
MGILGRVEADAHPGRDRPRPSGIGAYDPTGLLARSVARAAESL